MNDSPFLNLKKKIETKKETPQNIITDKPKEIKEISTEKNPDKNASQNLEKEEIWESQEKEGVNFYGKDNINQEEREIDRSGQEKGKSSKIINKEDDASQEIKLKRRVKKKNKEKEENKDDRFDIYDLLDQPKDDHEGRKEAPPNLMIVSLKNSENFKPKKKIKLKKKQIVIHQFFFMILIICRGKTKIQTWYQQERLSISLRKELPEKEQQEKVLQEKELLVKEVLGKTSSKINHPLQILN